MAQDDQPRPDLDDALDGVLPSLTVLDEHRVEASRLRAMETLRGSSVEGRPRLARLWPVMAAGTLAAILIVSARLLRPADDVPGSPAVLASRSVMTTVMTSPPIASRQLAVAPLDARRRVDDSSRSATRAPASDPLPALVRAVNAIPEDVWARGEAAASTAALVVRDLAVEPLTVAPLDVSAPVPTSPGEPR